MIEIAINSLLSGDATVTSGSSALATQYATYAAKLQALIGGGTANGHLPARVTRVQLRNNSTAKAEITDPLDANAAYPAVYFGRVESESTPTHDGTLATCRAFFDVHCAARTQEDATLVVYYLQQMLSDWRGTAGQVPAGVPVSGGQPFNIRWIWTNDQADLVVPPIGAQEAGIPEAGFRLEVVYDEP